MTSSSKRSLIAIGAGVLAIALMILLRNLIVDAPRQRLHKSERDGLTIYEGSWHFPRGGPYMLGFESPSGAAGLFIDGQPWVCGRGSQLKHEGQKLKQGASRLANECRQFISMDDAAAAGASSAIAATARKPFHPGVVAVRFVAPADARLVWIPPGRRSDPEYVSPSSLAPDPPARAEFTRWAGAAPVDGLFATLIAIILAAVIVFLFRNALRRIDRQTAMWAAAVLMVALAVRLVGLDGAGETWDENTNWSAGKNYITNLLALDFSQESWRWNYQHPPVSKYIAGLGAQWADGFGPARALSALMVAIACALMVPIGRRLFSLRVGVVAALASALTPHLIAHGKIVGHEAPMVLLWTSAILLCLAAHDPDPESGADPVSPRRFAMRLAMIGIILGLALWSRFANALLAPLIGSILMVNAPPGQRGRTLVYGITIIPLTALAVGLLLWPRLWSTPIAHLQQSWAKLKVPHSGEPFLGTVTNTPPRYYFAVYLFATAPLGLLVGAVAGGVRGLLWRSRSTLIALLWLTIPLLILFSPVRQDGVRYIMPALMALALFAALGYEYLATLLSRRLFFATRRRIAGALAALVVLYLAIVDYRIHPYYLDYYGEHYGGPAAVAKDRAFEIAWWGEGLGEAIAYVNTNAEPDARVHKRCISPYDHLGWLRGDLWSQLTSNPRSADWIVVYQPALRACPIPDGFTMVHEVVGQGASLARVYRRVLAEAP